MLRSKPFAPFVCLAITLYSLHSFAQKAKLELGAGPAMVSAWRNDGNTDDHKIKIAPLVGIGFQYHITLPWSADIKLLYELKGQRTEGPISYDPNPDPLSSGFLSYRLDINVNYLTLSVMMRYWVERINLYTMPGNSI